MEGMPSKSEQIDNELDKEVDSMAGTYFPGLKESALSAVSSAMSKEEKCGLLLGSDQLEKLSIQMTDLQSRAEKFKDDDGIVRNKPETREFIRQALILQKEIHRIDQNITEKFDRAMDDKKTTGDFS